MNTFEIECKLDLRHSGVNYLVFVSQDEESSDEKAVSGIYVLDTIFDEIPEIINVKFEWDENLNMSKIPRNCNVCKDDKALVVGCDFLEPTSRYFYQYKYRSKDRGYRYCNGLYIKKSILGDIPPKELLLTVTWK